MYNGHKNWNHWNVSLWLFNDERYYNWMRWCVKTTTTLDKAARKMIDMLDQACTYRGISSKNLDFIVPIIHTAFSIQVIMLPFCLNSSIIDCCGCHDSLVNITGNRFSDKNMSYHTQLAKGF